MKMFRRILQEPSGIRIRGVINPNHSEVGSIPIQWPCLLMCPHNRIKHKAAITVLNVCLDFIRYSKTHKLHR